MGLTLAICDNLLNKHLGQISTYTGLTRFVMSRIDWKCVDLVDNTFPERPTGMKTLVFALKLNSENDRQNE